MSFFISNAYAQSMPSSESLLSLAPLVIIFVVFYFLLIRPQSKRQKEHKALISNLSKGDEVTTAGGMLGKVTEVKDDFVKIQVADNVVVIVQKHTVGAIMPKGTIKSV
ncbi:MAG: preprotein translocase subunit YajC [Gammaproteobacteria bacterium]|nr:MAG: preprotein translocase subunit YajC [Gammaproteobacteria bacterium]